MKKNIQALFLFLLLPAASLLAQVVSAVSQHPKDFVIVSNKQQAVIAVDSSDDALVLKAAVLLQQDIEAVTGKKLSIVHNNTGSAPAIIIGSIQHSALVQQLVKEKKIQTDSLQHQWEGYRVQVVNNLNNNRALVITGSDRRGTAFGVFELSRQMGVSPWYWWADVPVQKKSALFFPAHALLADAPKVKYRGIFINDEAPALSGWTKEKFGGFNHLFYEKVFELILRLKGNYIWPAMWGNAFYDDDSLNIRSAEQYGIVIGTTHHEPLMRAHDEWRRYGKGKWNYDSNAAVLANFWRKGMERATNEKTVSVGMRGDGDKPMTQGTATSLLERIVGDQRKIIAEVTGKPLQATPQLWALYKEVQDYYDKGMRVPDDITLLLCDDNWGNIRKLPRLTDAPRSGGYGIYYHFDYVGDPRNYKWINTNNIARVWEQMHLAYEYGVNNIWIVNVGDIKPMEFPISFFLDYAWNPHAWNEDNLPSYYTSWSVAQFGQQQGAAIGKLINTYSRYAARIKPELLDANTYSLIHYHEADRVTGEWNELEQQAAAINRQLPGSYKDAFYQLVLHPIKAYGNLQRLYTAVAKNKFYAAQQDTAANRWAARAKQSYETDSLITLEYHSLGNHKWNHMMDQTHIGYTYWQQPMVNKMPALSYVTGQGSHSTATPATEDRVATIPDNHTPNLFYEKNGYISIEAAHWTTVHNNASVQWKVIPDIGRSGSGVSSFPVTVSVPLTNASPHLDYTFYSYSSGSCKLHLYFSPTLNFHNDEGLLFAVSVDQHPPVVVSLNKDDRDVRTWSKWVANNTIEKIVAQQLDSPGKHTLQYWMISPAVVLQKMVIDYGGLEQSFLGPPETMQLPATAVKTGLKDYYRDYFPVGVAVSPRALKTDEAGLILQQFNSLTPENAMKMGPIHPKENEYYWRDADSIVAFAQRNRLKVRGHNLCWHNQTPSWLFTGKDGQRVSKEVLLQRLKEHITAVVNRYKGKIYAWDVVNEAISDEPGEYLRNSAWLQICGEEYIAKAFQYAHEADPDALLFYNDYNEISAVKREKIYRLVRHLKETGVPIHGIGLQGHWAVNEPGEAQLDSTLQRFAGLGLKMQITELDISVYNKEHHARERIPSDNDTAFSAAKEARQMEVYSMCFRLFRKYRGQLSGVTFWNISDRHSWLDGFPVMNRKDYPLLFNQDLQPKKAYWEIINF